MASCVYVCAPRISSNRYYSFTNNEHQKKHRKQRTWCSGYDNRVAVSLSFSLFFSVSCVSGIIGPCAHMYIKYLNAANSPHGHTCDICVCALVKRNSPSMGRKQKKRELYWIENTASHRDGQRAHVRRKSVVYLHYNEPYLYIIKCICVRMFWLAGWTLTVRSFVRSSVGAMKESRSVYP